MRGQKLLFEKLRRVCRPFEQYTVAILRQKSVQKVKEYSYRLTQYITTYQCHENSNSFYEKLCVDSAFGVTIPMAWAVAMASLLVIIAKCFLTIT